MSTKIALPCDTAEGDEPACHRYEELGESGAAYLHSDDIRSNLLARERCLHEAARAGPARAVSEERAEVWAQKNAKAIACYNAYVEQNGLPLDGFPTDA